MFKKGDYIVLLYKWNQGTVSNDSFSQNYIYQQSGDLNRFSPTQSTDGNTLTVEKTKNWTHINFNSQSYWRYATQQEIAIFNKIGKPFNTLEPPKVELDPEYEIY